MSLITVHLVLPGNDPRGTITVLRTVEQLSIEPLRQLLADALGIAPGSALLPAVRHEGKELPLDLPLARSVPQAITRGEVLVELAWVAPGSVAGPAPGASLPPPAMGGVVAPPPAEESEEEEIDLSMDSEVPSEWKLGSDAAREEEQADECAVAEEEESCDLPSPDAAEAEGMMPDAMPARSRTVEAGRLSHKSSRRPAADAMPARSRTVEADRKTTRHATVRYYSRMNPDRMYPLLVALTRQALQAPEGQPFRQAGKSFEAALGSHVEIEPVLPGCDCYPPRQSIQLTGKDVAATFYVVPRVLGTVEAARILVRQGPQTLAEIPLEVKVRKTTAALALGAAAVLLPFTSAILKHFKVDFESQLQDGFGLYISSARLAVDSCTPESLALGLLGLTGASYLYLRPRQRDLFWEITPRGGQAAGGRERGLAGLLGRVGRGMRRYALIGGLAGLALGGLIVGLSLWVGSGDRSLAAIARVLAVLITLGIGGGAAAGIAEGVLGGDEEASLPNPAASPRKR